jgi:hypothetical protein
MLKNNLHKILFVILACFLVLVTAIPASAASAAAPKTYENGMKTPPPPKEDLIPYYRSTTSSISTGGISIMSMNPGDIYLDSGASIIGINPANGAPVFQGSTTAQMMVAEVGVVCELQQWNGSYWVTVATSPSITAYNNAGSSTSATYNAPRGYYYRTYSTHWAINNGKREQGNSASDWKPFS